MVTLDSLFTFLLAMTPTAACGRQQIAQTCSFGVKLRSRFLDNGSTDSEKVYSIGNCDSRASFLLGELLDVFAPRL